MTVRTDSPGQDAVPPLSTAGPDAAARRFWILYAAAALTFLPAIGFYYVGEEAILPLAALEMWHRGEWSMQVLYGGDVRHNPLPNWLVMAFAAVFGWEHMLAILRGITIAATIGSGLVLAWLARALYGDAAFAAFAALVYLTLADLFLYRGWLAYADPLFGFFLFGAVAFLWVACLRRSARLVVLAAAALTCAFMTKALTAYAFYGAAVLVLLADRDHRAFLLGRASLAAHLAAALAPLAWLFWVRGGSGQGSRMFGEIVAKLLPAGFVEYLTKLGGYTFETLWALSPAVLIAAYFAWRQRGGQIAKINAHDRSALGIAALGYLPYWLAPFSSLRYLLPIYPLAGLIVARWLWRSGPRAVEAAQRWLAGFILVKLALVVAVFPYYQQHYRGANFAETARQIAERTEGQPLYVTNDSASGLSVAAHIAILRLPAPPLTFPPQEWQSGFVIAHQADPGTGQVAAMYRLGGRTLYLLCRGTACGKAAP